MIFILFGWVRKSYLTCPWSVKVLVGYFVHPVYPGVQDHAINPIGCKSILSLRNNCLYRWQWKPRQIFSILSSQSWVLTIHSNNILQLSFSFSMINMCFLILRLTQWDDSPIISLHGPVGISNIVQGWWKTLRLLVLVYSSSDEKIAVLWPRPASCCMERQVEKLGWGSGGCW